MPYEHDESKWPIVVSRSIGESEDADIAAYIAAHEAAISRGPHVVILDARNGVGMSGKHRKQVADWIREAGPRLVRSRLGLAFVSGSLVTRGLITATYWLTPPPYPQQSFKTMPEAEAWASELLAAKR